MSTPMYDLPEHLAFPVDIEECGPAEGDDVDHYVCWCWDKDCPWNEALKFNRGVQ